MVAWKWLHLWLCFSSSLLVDFWFLSLHCTLRRGCTFWTCLFGVSFQLSTRTTFTALFLKLVLCDVYFEIQLDLTVTRQLIFTGISQSVQSREICHRQYPLVNVYDLKGLGLFCIRKRHATGMDVQYLHRVRTFKESIVSWDSPLFQPPYPESVQNKRNPHIRFTQKLLWSVSLNISYSIETKALQYPAVRCLHTVIFFMFLWEQCLNNQQTSLKVYSKYMNHLLVVRGRARKYLSDSNWHCLTLSSKKTQRVVKILYNPLRVTFLQRE